MHDPLLTAAGMGIDATGRREPTFPASAMKKLLLLSALFLGPLLGLVRADIPPPKPTLLTVKNLAAFPEYKFSYTYPYTSSPIKPLPDDKVVECSRNVQLLVQSGADAPQVWATLPHEWRGKRVTLVVDKVERQGKTIRVTYRDINALTPDKKGAGLGGDSRLLFALAAGGACGLVLLARRGRSAA